MTNVYPGTRLPTRCGGVRQEYIIKLSTLGTAIIHYYGEERREGRR